MLRTTVTTRRVKGVPAVARGRATAGPPNPLKSDADADAERRAAKVGLVEGLGHAAETEGIRHPAIARLAADQDMPRDGDVDAAHDVVRGEALGEDAVVVGCAIAERADAAAGEVGERGRDRAAARLPHGIETVPAGHLERLQPDRQRDAEAKHLAFVDE